MTRTTRRPIRALALPASIAILAGAGATTAGLLSPQRASAVTCPVLAASPTTYATPGENCFTVPAGVSVINAVLKGGTGGDGATGTGGISAGVGGKGGHGMQVSGTVTVTASEVIWVYVGGNGTAGAINGSGGVGGSTAALTGAATATAPTTPAAAAVPPTYAPRRQPRRSPTAEATSAVPTTLQPGRPVRSSWWPAAAAAVATAPMLPW
jgi:hypothetical protein